MGIKIIVAEDKFEAGKLAADIYEKLISAKPGCVLGLATGSTPLPLYAELAKRCEEGKIDFSKVSTVNLDEYIGLSPDHPQSYRYFMNENLFSKINIDMANTAVPDGIAADTDAACMAYEEHIKALGGIDLQLLGLGHDGHIGFNEPDTCFPCITHVTELNDMTIDANTRFFASRDEVPTKAMTSGIGTIMGAEAVVMIVTGSDKAGILSKVVHGPVTPAVPASVLRFHHNVTLICDKDAAAEL